MAEATGWIHKPWSRMKPSRMPTSKARASGFLARHHAGVDELVRGKAPIKPHPEEHQMADTAEMSFSRYRTSARIPPTMSTAGIGNIVTSRCSV